MSNPAEAASGGQAAGAIVNAFGDIYSGNATKSMYDYQAGVAKVNATLAKQDANYALEAGEVEAQQTGMKTRAQVGATKAGFSAGNIDTTTGSASKVIASEHEIGQENQGIVRANAAKRAYGFNVAAAQDDAQSTMFTYAGRNAQTAGEIGAVSSILGGAGSVSSKWIQASQSYGSGGSTGGSSGGTPYGPDYDPTYSNYGFGRA